MSGALEEAVGFRFRRPELLRAALTHRSALSECGVEVCNERLEFLGDSVLSAIVAHRLFDLHPSEAEGRLSKRKALLVSKPSLARWAKSLELGRHLYLGPGEEASGGRSRPSILSDALEALIGAVYLDGGFEAARRMVARWIEDEKAGFEETDFKSRLQELMQKRFRAPPRYETVSTQGPEHDKTFSVAARMGKEVLGRGSGKSKKEAEQAAARDALGRLRSRG